MLKARTFSFLFLTLAAFTAQAQKPDQRLWQDAAASAKAGKYAVALGKFQTALRPVKDQNLFRQAAAILQNSGAKEEHLFLYLWGRKTLKDDKAFARELAEAYSAQLSYPQALPEWAVVFETQPDYARLKIEEIAPVYGYLASAKLLEAAGGSRKGEWQALLSGLYLMGQDYARAWENCKKIPDQKVSGLVLKRLVNSPGLSPDQAAGMVEDHISRNPTDIEYWQYRLAELYIQDGQTGKAERVYRGIKGGPAGLYLARLLLEQSRRPEESLEVIKLSQRDLPDSLKAEGFFLKARCFFSLDLPDSSRSIYLALADSSQSLQVRQPALFFLGEHNLMAGDLDGAMGCYRQAAALGPDDDAVNDALSRLLLITDYKTDKMNVLQEWARGLKYQNQFRPGPAETTYLKVIQSDSSGQLADLSLAGLAEISSGGRDYKKAAEYWGRIFSSSGDSLLAAEACYQRGLLLRDRLSDPQKAVKNWEEGVIRYSATSWADLMREELSRSRAAKP